MESRRFELNALLVLEAGKPWIEADGDVSEAIDFCRVLRGRDAPARNPRRHAIRAGRGVRSTLGPPRRRRGHRALELPACDPHGSRSRRSWRATCVIINARPPDPIIGAQLMEVLTQAGVPPGVLAYLPCNGPDRRRPSRLRIPKSISMRSPDPGAVGCGIWEAAGKTHFRTGQPQKVVCEMGGKNALIIDNDADLDEAISGRTLQRLQLRRPEMLCALPAHRCSKTSTTALSNASFAACPTIPIGDPAQPRDDRQPRHRRLRAEKHLGLHRTGASGRPGWHGRPGSRPSCSTAAVTTSRQRSSSMFVRITSSPARKSSDQWWRF